MTTYQTTDTARGPATSWALYAALGAGVSLVLGALGTFLPAQGDEQHGWGELAIVAGIVVVATAIVFGLVVRTAAPANAGPRAVVLSVLGLAALLVFWTGLPCILAFGALGCAVASRRDGAGMPTSAKVGAGIGILTIALAVVAAVIG